jgi:hypothetical protein
LPDDIAEHTFSLKDQYFDLKGLAAYSALGVGTLRDHIRESRLPCFKVKGKILVKRSEFDRWMETQRMDVEPTVDRIVNDVIDSLKKDKSDK